MLAQVFWGLWMLPLSSLVFSSGFLPRFLGMPVLIAAAGYLVDSGTHLLFPGRTTIAQLHRARRAGAPPVALEQGRGCRTVASSGTEPAAIVAVGISRASVTSSSESRFRRSSPTGLRTGCARASATWGRPARWRSLSSLSVVAQSRPSWIAGTTTTSRDGSRQDSGRGRLKNGRRNWARSTRSRAAGHAPPLRTRRQAEKTSELAKTAHFRYLELPLEERRRLLETVLPNCTIDRGSLCADIRRFVSSDRSRDWRSVWDVPADAPQARRVPEAVHPDEP